MSESSGSLSPEKISAGSCESESRGIASPVERKISSSDISIDQTLMSIGSSQMESSESLVSTVYLLDDGAISEDSSRCMSLLGTLNEDAAPAIDPHALQDIETHAKRIADQLFHMMSLLTCNLCKISGCTLDSIEIYSNTVDGVCDSLDTNIKAMYALIAKSEEVSKQLSVALSIKDEVNEIKRVIDQLEVVVMKDVKKN